MTRLDMRIVDPHILVHTKYAFKILEVSFGENSTQMSLCQQCIMAAVIVESCPEADDNHVRFTHKH